MNDVRTRFIEAYNCLLKEGLVSGYKDFASKISVSPSMITEISKGRSNVGMTAIQNIVEHFRIDADWLLTGRGSMIRSELPELPERHTIPTSSVDSFTGEAIAYYKMYKEEKEENKILIAENSTLKERLRILEETTSITPTSKSPDNTGNLQKVSMIQVDLSEKEKISEL